MAKIRMGTLAAQIRGSVGGTTFSQNRYGAYARTRSIPTVVTSVPAQLAKANLSTLSRAWGGLSDADKLAWTNWAQTNPVVDVFGEQQTLSGNTAYIKCNGRLLAAGVTPINLPPTTTGPPGFLTVTLSTDIGAGNFQVAFTPTPAGATMKILTWVAVVDSAGRNYVKNLLKLVNVSATNIASPIALQPSVEARFGTLQVDQVVHCYLQRLDISTGLASIGYPAQSTVVST